MKTQLLKSALLTFVCFFGSQAVFAAPTQNTATRCQASCAGIPKGQCSCVTTDGIKCCGKRTDGLSAKPVHN